MPILLVIIKNKSVKGGRPIIESQSPVFHSTQIFYHFFSQQNIQVIGFVVSSADNLPEYADVPVMSLQDLGQAAPDLVLNCIEGGHEDDVTQRIMLSCPGVHVLSWRDFCVRQSSISQ